MNHKDYPTYGEKIAEIYDEWFAVPEDAQDAASFLSELVNSGMANVSRSSSVAASKRCT